MPTRVLTLTLPIPHKRLLPNGSHGHWRPKSEQVKVHRHRAKLITLSALNGNPPPKITSYTLSFYFETSRNRDDDNYASSFKSYRDGIADAFRIDDNNLRMAGSPEMLIDPANPRLEVHLYE